MVGWGSGFPLPEFPNPNQQSLPPRKVTWNKADFPLIITTKPSDYATCPQTLTQTFDSPLPLATTI